MDNIVINESIVRIKKIIKKKKVFLEIPNIECQIQDYFV